MSCNKSNKRKSNVHQNGNSTSCTRKPKDLERAYDDDDDISDPQPNGTEDAVERRQRNSSGSCSAEKKRRRLTKVVWSSKPTSTRITQMPVVREPKLKCTPAKTPLDAWSLLFTDELLNVVLEHTNARIKDTNGSDTPVAHHRETDLTELKAVTGLFYCVGLYRVNKFKLKHLWEPHGPSRFRLTMTLKRFEFLLDSLRLDDVWDGFVSNFSKHYVPGTECAMVERGPIVALIDASTGYVINACKAENVVVGKLTLPIYGSSCTVVCGRKFTSVDVFEEMRSECGVDMVGEIEESLVPDEFKEGQKFGYHKVKTLISYRDDRETVLLLSTKFGSDKIDEKTKVPEIVSFYKKTRLAAEKFDKRCREFSTARKTNNQSLRLFYAMLDAANHNSFILYSLLSSNKLLKPYEFLTKLMLSLTHDQMRTRPFKRGLPLSLRLQIEEHYTDPNEYAPDHDVKDEIPDSKMDQRKLCGYCPDNLNRKTWYECIKCKRPMCYGHQCKLCETCGELQCEDI